MVNPTKSQQPFERWQCVCGLIPHSRSLKQCFARSNISVPKLNSKSCSFLRTCALFQRSVIFPKKQMCPNLETAGAFCSTAARRDAFSIGCTFTAGEEMERSGESRWKLPTFSVFIHKIQMDLDGRHLKARRRTDQAVHRQSRLHKMEPTRPKWSWICLI